jgi:Tol biopolymer transport system component
LALGRDVGNVDIWVYDIRRQTMIRLTAGWDNEWPLWTPDGQDLVYTSNRAGVLNVYSTSAGGNEPAELLLDQPETPSSWSPNDNGLVLTVEQPGRGYDLAAWDPSTGELRTLLSSPFNEAGAVVSPDGRWVAYRSDDSGRDEIFVARFPSMNDRSQVSVDGATGVWPTAASWSRDGRRLYYVSGSRIMGVTMRADSTFEAGLPETIFEFPNLDNFDVSPDGKTFAVITRNATPVTHLNVVLNWLDELEEVPR